MDSRFFLSVEDENSPLVWLKCLKQKDSEPTKQEQLRKVVVDLREEPLLADMEAKDRNSLVVVPVVPAFGRPKTHEEAKQEKAARKRREGREKVEREEEERVLAVLRANPGIPRNPKKGYPTSIQQEAGWGEGRTEKAVSRLEREGKVVPDADPQRHRPTLWFVTEAPGGGTK